MVLSDSTNYCSNALPQRALHIPMRSTHALSTVDPLATLYSTSHMLPSLRSPRLPKTLASPFIHFTSILSLAPDNSSSLVIPSISFHNVLPFTESTGLSSYILFEFHFMLSLSLQPFALPGKSQSSHLHRPCSKHTIGNVILILAS